MAYSIGSLKFPMVCASCGETTGNPVGMSDPTRVVVTVMITCANCNRMWTERAERPPVITPKGRGQ